VITSTPVPSVTVWAAPSSPSILWPCILLPSLSVASIVTAFVLAVPIINSAFHPLCASEALGNVIA